MSGRQLTDEQHHQMMNAARIQQSLPKEYLEKLLETYKKINDESNRVKTQNN